MVKKLVVKKGIECQACKACMQACSNAYFKTFDEALSCIQLGERNGAVKPVVCSQCGKCAEACPMHVIAFKQGGTASKCIACGICAKACPMEILEIVEK